MGVSQGLSTWLCSQHLALTSSPSSSCSLIPVFDGRDVACLQRMKLPNYLSWRERWAGIHAETLGIMQVLV